MDMEETTDMMTDLAPEMPMDPVMAMKEMLRDWFETIEEMEMTSDEASQLMEVSDMLSGLKTEAQGMGIQAEDFDEWLRFYVLEQWSDLLDEDAPENPMAAFYEYIRDGQQRLYFHMMKHCTAGLDAETA